MSQATSSSEPFKPHPIFGDCDFRSNSLLALQPLDALSETTGSDEDYAPSSFEPSDATQPTRSSSSHGPSHYKRGKIEVWDFIRDQQLNYHLGCAVKYICRAGFKDAATQDLAKAIHYLQNELENRIE